MFTVVPVYDTQGVERKFLTFHIHKNGFAFLRPARGKRLSRALAQYIADSLNALPLNEEEHHE